VLDHGHIIWLAVVAWGHRLCRSLRDQGRKELNSKMTWRKSLCLDLSRVREDMVAGCMKKVPEVPGTVVLYRQNWLTHDVL
jgi:hypothetical protein